MNDIENEIKRKIKTRKFAIENLGNGVSFDKNDESDITTSSSGNYFLQYRENIQAADQSKLQDGYFPIQSDRRILGKFYVFIKKAIRKILHALLGWYIKPIFDKQTYFNGKIVNSVNILTDIMMDQEQKYNIIINELKNEISLLKKENNELKNNSNNQELINVLEASINDLNSKTDYVLDRLNITCDINLLKQNNMDYFKFEDTFRGTREGVKAIQSVYVPYFANKGKGSILDIGCGRGEFLELMWEHGISSYGVDNYDPFVNYCNNRGFNVIKSDALTHLISIEDCSLSGIFMSQVVEHLSNDYIMALIKTAYKKLKPGCYFILETPNPDCLAAISEFNIDMSHIKPVHYKALEYLFKEARYQSVERYHTEQTIYPLRAKHIDGENINNIDEFNQGIDYINQLLFGYRDYTLIAKK
jgi:O-antigen chain-terminating methyltransferase